ncbi:porin family protein [Acinetobacter bereziniae]|jgi:opacity protein-like surface antigen|nr:MULTISPECIES: porin family protein [Acinetobacter]KKW80713.1 membrane protein [Acinetobacter sp. Ag2]MBJ8422857.1 porin family protein [Acinetobacter bereziniae]MBJ8446217.1 porin family protein [Acinetobacter bereziniae]MBJ8453147.1 porin family protein [Acinetobacter bereziniae]MBJ8458557.1 porin family protein [Acinetobacter bereziniae]
MKKLLLVSILGALSVTSHAANTEIQPYVGAGYTYLDNDVDIHFLGLNAGVQFNQYIGAEAFWNKSVNDIKFDEDFEELGVRTDADVQYYGVALTGKYPLENNFYAKGMVGYTRVDLDVDAQFLGYKVSESEDDSGVIIQAGGGYNFTKNIAAELAYTYISAFDGFNGVNLQLKYNF